MACKIKWFEHGTLFSHSDTVTDEEVKTFNDIMYGDRRFEHIRYQISDYSAVTDNRITVRDAKVIGTLDRTSSRWNNHPMKIAVVTTDENFIPIVVHYFSELNAMGWKTKIFNTLKEAQAWVK